jgi:hypothetical protein
MTMHPMLTRLVLLLVCAALAASNVSSVKGVPRSSRLATVNVERYDSSSPFVHSLKRGLQKSKKSMKSENDDDDGKELNVEEVLFAAVAPLSSTTAPFSPTPAPLSPTRSPISSTASPVSPTVAPVFPTHAPFSPTGTPINPTRSPVSPTAAPISLTAAPISPTTEPAPPVASPLTPPVAPATPAPVVPATPAPAVPATPAPAVPATPAPVIPATATVVPATPAPVVPATPAPVVPATPAPVVPATPAPAVPATLAPVVPATPAPVVPATTAPVSVTAAPVASPFATIAPVVEGEQVVEVFPETPAPTGSAILEAACEAAKEGRVFETARVQDVAFVYEMVTIASADPNVVGDEIESSMQSFLIRDLAVSTCATDSRRHLIVTDVLGLAIVDGTVLEGELCTGVAPDTDVVTCSRREAAVRLFFDEEAEIDAAQVERDTLAEVESSIASVAAGSDAVVSVSYAATPSDTGSDTGSDSSRATVDESSDKVKPLGFVFVGLVAAIAVASTVLFVTWYRTKQRESDRLKSHQILSLQSTGITEEHSGEERSLRNVHKPSQELFAVQEGLESEIDHEDDFDNSSIPREIFRGDLDNVAFDEALADIQTDADQIRIMGDSTSVCTEGSSHRFFTQNMA